MTAIKIPSRNRDKIILIDLEDLHEICTWAVDQCPHDKRTKEGRAFVEGAWAIQDAAHKFAGEEKP